MFLRRVRYCSSLNCSRLDAALFVRFDTFLHEHDSVERPRDYMGVGKQRKEGRLQDKSTGVNSSMHTLVAVREDRVETGEAFIRVEVRAWLHARANCVRAGLMGNGVCLVGCNTRETDRDTQRSIQRVVSARWTHSGHPAVPSSTCYVNACVTVSRLAHQATLTAVLYFLICRR